MVGGMRTGFKLATNRTERRANRHRYLPIVEHYLAMAAAARSIMRPARLKGCQRSVKDWILVPARIITQIDSQTGKPSLMINRPRRNDSHAEWLIEKQMRVAEAPHWLIQAQASLERSLQNIRSPDEWEQDFLKDKCKLPEPPTARSIIRPSTRLSGTTDASLLASLLLDLSKLLDHQPQPHMRARDLVQ
jgi:hypothetical protein